MTKLTKHPQGILYIISAPSGAGKTTLVNKVMQSCPNVCLSISHTTREPREGERNGKEYHFVTHAEFENMVQEQIFLEHAFVFGQYYGTSRLWVMETLRQGKDVILEIDWQGARQIRSQLMDTQSIYILPPSQAALRERLRKRHAGKEEDIIELRMKAAKKEMLHYQEYDYLICNDNFEEALEDLKAIIRSQRLRLRSQEEYQAALIGKLIT